MTRACISVLAFGLVSVACSGAIACDPAALEKNFASVQEEEERWQIFSIKESCAVLTADVTAVEHLETLKEVFDKGTVTNATARGTIEGCSAEQVIAAAC